MEMELVTWQDEKANRKSERFTDEEEGRMDR
jgi:hypothetical protein